ncbi:BPTD_3080 family restriction endonuclease [Antribacter gilvus]|uniref:BPTD_3080 family restriction endonuclease n=1 Tax=Antribacter gilvus TaxID=2304675 RepID=UPI001F0B7C8C|nr:DEAD/DEAH box helicase family protein [Antribacter gilvus]
MGDDAVAVLANPILNGPYDPPARHFEMGLGGPTGRVVEGRRPSESLIPIAQARKSRQAAARVATAQDELDFDVTGERREKNLLINDLRREVELWRVRGYSNVTPLTRTLLEHWADPARENRVLFGQREAVETAIYLAEAAGRAGNTDWRRRLDGENDVHNAGLPRVALKMATGSGKTVVMAMLIAWQTINKVQSPRDSRFSKRFLVVTPGITIRDRLRVLIPGEPGNYYDVRDLIPPQHQAALREAQVVITNYHSFLPRDAKEIQGVSRTTRQILLGDAANSPDDPFRESPDAVVSRVLRGFTLPSGRVTSAASEIVVFNDEAHHCYRYNPELSEDLTKEEREANREAGVWFTGLQWVAKRVGIKAVYDLSATPFYLKASGYTEGYIFPWVVSDFSLMDAIESGLVKVPRTPVDDDAADKRVTYLHLWDHVGRLLPKRKTAAALDPSGWVPPKELEGALRSLYRSYERAYEQWVTHLRDLGEPPPVYIVVANNTIVSKLIYDWVAGGPVLDKDGSPVLHADGSVVHRTGNLPLFSNVVDGAPAPRPPAIIVDSKQLESGETLSGDFKADAAAEIEAFKAEFRRRNPGGDVESITDADLLREVMNTVGKKGMLGEQVRCVVSVSMLTEGWDANTVTHILGVRAFGSQLLCEQVVGRGLRRRSYALNDEGRFEPEYASIYGIPFSFIPTTGETPDVTPKRPAVWVHSVEGREDLRIQFPKLDGYRLEIPDEDVWLDDALARPFIVGASTVPRWTESAGIVGTAELEDGDLTDLRAQELAYLVAKRLIDTHLRTQEGDDGDRRPWLFPRLAGLCREWIERNVRVENGYSFNALRLVEAQAELADQINASLTSQTENRRPVLRPVLRTFDPVGHTGEVSFETRKKSRDTVKSEVSHVVLDGKDGNTWEDELANVCESIADVEAYVKNDHLGLTIPYIHKGRSHDYLPDFVLKLRQRDDDVQRFLIVEVSGGQKAPGPTQIKATTARDSWCAAVNNHGGFGRWGYLEVGLHKALFFNRVRQAIDLHYADRPIVGDPDLLDIVEREARRGA